MKRTLLQRIEALEEQLAVRTIPRLQVLDVLDLPDADRARYWSGDATILDQLGLPTLTDPSAPPVAVVIDLHPAQRDEWLQSRDLDPSEAERLDQIEADERDQREREELAAKLTMSHLQHTERSAPAVIGWDRHGRPVFDSDPPDRRAERVPGT